MHALLHYFRIIFSESQERYLQLYPIFVCAISLKILTLRAELSSLKNPMKKAYKSPPKKGAFGSSSKSPFGSDSPSATTVMQKDMWEDMEPVEEDEAPWWTQISFGQVVSTAQQPDWPYICSSTVYS